MTFGSPGRSFGSYSDLVVVAGLALLAGVAVAVDAPTALRTACGVPAILAAPGYAAVAALFPRALPDVWACLVASVTVSIAIAIWTGLSLYALGISLAGDALPLAVTAITLVLAAAAMRLRSTRGGRPPTLPRPALGHVALAGVIGILLVYAVATAREPRQASDVAGYSALWATRSSPQAIQVGIRSAELHPLDFRVEVRAADGQVAWSSAVFRLLPGQRRTFDVAAAGRGPLDVALVRADESKPYRRVAVS